MAKVHTVSSATRALGCGAVKQPLVSGATRAPRMQYVDVKTGRQVEPSAAVKKKVAAARRADKTR